jgi:hypothetical protein
MKQFNGSFFLFLGLISLNGCGPMYNTEYSLVPPKSESGRACTYHCDSGKMQCRQIEELRVDRCQIQAREDDRECEARIRWDKGRSPKWYECGSSSCTADYDQCDAQYRSCFQSCGGRVETTTRCVANCDQIPKASAPGKAKQHREISKTPSKEDFSY